MATNEKQSEVCFFFGGGLTQVTQKKSCFVSFFVGCKLSLLMTAIASIL